MPINEFLDLAKLQALLSGWSHGPLATAEEGGVTTEHPQRHRLLRRRDGLTSKSLWRLLFIVAIVLFLLNVSRLGIQRFQRTRIDTGHPLLQVSNETTSSAASGDVDWSQYAYFQYVTNADYLCNSLMIFESLHRLESKASRVMLYPQEWTADMGSGEGRLLLKAHDEFHVHLHPVAVQHLPEVSTWADSLTKLLAFNQTQYKRVLSLDSDATVLQVS